MSHSEWQYVESDKGVQALVNPDQVKVIFDLGDRRKIDLGDGVYVYTAEAASNLANLLNPPFDEPAP